MELRNIIISKILLFLHLFENLVSLKNISNDSSACSISKDIISSDVNFVYTKTMIIIILKNIDRKNNFHICFT